MMADFLLQLLIMSFQASVIFLVVMLLGWIFSKLHIAKKYVVLLWFIPYIAMILPWSIKTPFSFWNLFYEEQTKLEQQMESMPYRTEVIGEVPVTTEAVDVGTDVSMDGTTEGSISVADDLPERWQPPSLNGNSGMDETENGLSAILMSLFQGYTLWEAALNLAFGVWFIGMCTFFMVGIVSSLKLRKKLVCKLLLKENIYVADDIKEPFVFGVLKPAIYLPYSLKTEDEIYVIEHEKTHIMRKDPIKKVLAFSITGIHWFNPFAYVMFHMMTKDMEMACDEETIKRIGVEKKKEYASSLLKLSTGKRNVLIPVAFGEGNVKSRITNILNYKKSLGIFSAIAVVAVLLVAVFFLTKPAEAYVPLAVAAIDPEDSVMSTPGEGKTRDIVVFYEGEEYHFSEAYYNSFRIFLEEMEVRNTPLDKSRDEARDAEVVIRFLNESSFSDYNFNSDCSKLWYDNYVKPSYTYEVKEPKLVIQFLAAQISGLEDIEGDVEAGDSEVMDNQNSDIKQEIELLDYSQDIYCNADYPKLIYADEYTLVFETENFLFLYRWKGECLNYWLKSDMHKIESGYAFNAPDSDMIINAPEVEKKSLTDITEDEPTIFRTKDCIEIAENQFVYLESGSGELVDLQAVILDEDGITSIYSIFKTYTGSNQDGTLWDLKFEMKLMEDKIIFYNIEKPHSYGMWLFEYAPKGISFLINLCSYQSSPE